MDISSDMQYVKPTPVFSFNTIIDEDVSLLIYIILNYYDESVFDFSEYMTVDFAKVINKLYYRTVENPLRLFMIEGADEEFVDECYKEFLTTKEEEILKNGIMTEIPDLIQLYQNSSGITPSIFYYNDIQLETLERIEAFDNIEKIKVSEITNDKYSQIYVNKIEEVKNFPHLENKTFYMATSQLNLECLDHLDDYDYLINLISNGNRISLYDLYMRSIINKGD